MATVELPPQFKSSYTAATQENKTDLSLSGKKLKDQGLSAEEIAERITNAGWDKEFALWYAQSILSQEGDVQIAIPAAYPRPQLDQADDKRKAAAKSGPIIAIIATLWVMAYPFVSIATGLPSLVLGIIGIGLLWEGFARLAYGKGLGRLHGACSVTILIVNIALSAFWVTQTQGFRGDLAEEFQSSILMTATIFPIALAWLMFFISTRMAGGAKRPA